MGAAAQHTPGVHTGHREEGEGKLQQPLTHGATHQLGNQPPLQSADRRSG